MQASKLHPIKLELSPELRPLQGVISNKISHEDRITPNNYGSPKNFFTPKNMSKVSPKNTMNQTQ